MNKTQKKTLVKKLISGEKSGFVSHFDRKLHLKKLHAKQSQAKKPNL